MDAIWLIVIALVLLAGLLAVFLVRAREKVAILEEQVVSAQSKLAEAETVQAEVATTRHLLLQAEREKGALQGECKIIPDLISERDRLNQELSSALADVARLNAERSESAKAHAQQIEQLTAVRDDLIAKFKNLASESLRDNQTAFIQLANEIFERHRQNANGDLEARQVAVKALIDPVVSMIGDYQAKIADLTSLQHGAYGTLTAELKQVVEAQNQVRQEASKLANALRAAPKTRGRWGENTLKNVIELSGLSSHCDFTLEQTIRDGSAIFRPDLIINLPGERTLAVDAKTALQAYLDAVDATDEAEREKHLQLHAAQLRQHAKQLGSKAYWEKLEHTPDFVIMFVPGDNFYSAAVERDPQLFEDAVANRVLIATPATLIALAKAVAYGWRQEKVAENTRAVHILGRELYKRLNTMGGHIADMGARLSAAVKGYNSFVGSLEGSVMPQARKFNELEVEGAATPIPILEAIEQDVRVLTPDRDIALPPPASVA